MKPCKITVRLAAVFIAAALAAPAVAQNTNSAGASAAPAAAQPDMAAMMAMMTAMAKPGENHKILAGMTGTWTYAGKSWMSPDTNMPPTAFSGTTVTKASMGGRYFLTEHKGTMMVPGPDGKLQDTEFDGMELAGYDNMKRKFVSTWIDNFGTGIMLLEGTYDPAAKAITYRAEEEAMPGMKSKVREVVTLTDADHRKMEYFEDQGAGEMKVMEVLYTKIAPSP